MEIIRKLIAQIMSNDSIPQKGFSFSEINSSSQAKTLGMSFTASERIDPALGRPELGLAIVTW